MYRTANRLVICLIIVLLVSPLAKPLTMEIVFASPEEKYLTILHTNDEHSALLPSPLVNYQPFQQDPTLGGFARLAQAVTNIRTSKSASDEPVLLLSAGDYLGGSPFAWLALDGKAAELSLMIDLGYDVVTIGNHEYDFGPEALADYLQAAGYPSAASSTAIVATNTVPPSSHPLANMGIQKTHIQTLTNGLRVGYFGVLGNDAINKAPYATGIDFSDPEAAARQAVVELQQAGVDIIIAVNHSGLKEDREMAKSVPGIHVIVSGHSHDALHQPIVESGTIIVQTGSLLNYLGILELAYNPTTKEVRIRNQETGNPHLLAINSQIETAPVWANKVDMLTHDLNDLISRMSNGQFTNIFETVVYSDFEVRTSRMEESAFGNFITDAMRYTVSKATGDKVDFAIQANGIIRGSIAPGTIPGTEGKVAFMDVADLVGLGIGPDGTPGYPMVSVYLTGEEVRRVLEIAVLLSELMGDSYFLQFSGLRMTFDPARAVLMQVPVINKPLPSTRAVLSAERYTGDGFRQSGDQFVPLKRGDTQLYHVVADYYLAAFLPLAGELLPSLGLVMKDKDGNPITPEEGIVYRDGQELKTWQAVMEYAAAQPVDAAGNPRIPSYYASINGRLLTQKTIPLLLYPAAALLLVIALIWIAIKRRRRTKNIFSRR